MKITYYLEVISSWCYWAEPAWAELKQKYHGRAEFHWKIASMPAEAYPASKSQCEWYYRRSGSIVRSPFMLNSDWFEPDIKVYLAPNLVSEAAKDFGFTDDRIRLAIANAALREGRKVGRMEESIAVASAAGKIDPAALRAKAESPEVAARIQASTAEFTAMQVDQRPTFLLQDKIGDRVVLSGLATLAPIAAAVDAMLADEAAYASYATHFGGPPT